MDFIQKRKESKSIMKRREGESFADYRIRRAVESVVVKEWLNGRKIKYTYKELKKLWAIIDN